MKTIAFFTFFFLVIMSLHAELKDVAVGDDAPDFSLTGLDGKKYHLSQFRGKTIVLEWINPGCPFSHAQYTSGNVPGLQEKYTKEGIIWLTINSTREDHPEAKTADECRAFYAESRAAATAHLVDIGGTVGKLYGAKTTPHMFVISSDGKIAYNGAIDDDRSTNGGRNAKLNYVAQALEELKAGKTVTITTTKPYGCSVKY
jgi:AhpC/TSA family protein